MRYVRRILLLSLALILILIFFFLSDTNHGPISTGGPGGLQPPTPLFDTNVFTAGIPKPPGEKYSKLLVMGRLQKEDISWISSELPDLDTAIYEVDSPNTTLPANKGHEAMVYLTYIIEHYDSLPDIVYFFHAHRAAWHNNILLDIANPTTIKTMSSNHIIRQGYMNSRCHHDPGCPNWLHIDRSPWRYNLKKRPEEPFLTSALFAEMHPGNIPKPQSISQPCCAQFAVSGARIRARPLDFYKHYRNWLLSTPLPDSTSGRLMEYTWQYLFTGLFEFCPPQHACYCDGYGICFGGESGLQAWLKVLRQREKIELKMQDLEDRNRKDSAQYRTLTGQKDEISGRLQDMKNAAVERGNDARLRAAECGREWKLGDGY